MRIQVDKLVLFWLPCPQFSWFCLSHGPIFSSHHKHDSFFRDKKLALANFFYRVNKPFLWPLIAWVFLMNQRVDVQLIFCTSRTPFIMCLSKFACIQSKGENHWLHKFRQLLKFSCTKIRLYVCMLRLRDKLSIVTVVVSTICRMPQGVCHHQRVIHLLYCFL